MTIEEQLKEMIAQRDHAYQVYHQAIGAISMLEHLIKTKQADGAMPLEDFVEMIGGEGATAEVVENSEGGASE